MVCMKRMILFCILCTVFVCGFTALSATAQESEKIVVNYRGELVDQDARAISGVLPLKFKIYAQERAKKSIAEESHFVAVVDGTYLVLLGNESTIRSKASQLWVGVELEGRELTRQKVATQVIFEAPKESIVLRSDEVGAQTGESYQLNCPQGYVVTGIEGTSGEALHSLKLVCTKLF
jgi:hypothetical protein